MERNEEGQREREREREGERKQGEWEAFLGEEHFQVYQLTMKKNPQEPLKKLIFTKSDLNDFPFTFIKS